MEQMHGRKMIVYNNGTYPIKKKLKEIFKPAESKKDSQDRIEKIEDSSPS